jgi:phosphatidylethanolamine/phosphatidyl-N-methylethanolamine N-methyltransferase
LTKQLFFKRFLANPGIVGALLPSSPALCREITSHINIESAEAVVELGPGTGVITDEILARLNPQAKFVAIELDDKMYNALRQNRPDLNIVNDSAVNLPKIMEKAEIRHLNTIVSGLPWAAFPEQLQLGILNAVVDSLCDGGYFTTFAYLQGLLLPAGQRFKKLLKKSFREVKISRVIWNNVPPAIVYRCKK